MKRNDPRFTLAVITSAIFSAETYRLEKPRQPQKDAWDYDEQYVWRLAVRHVAFAVAQQAGLSEKEQASFLSLCGISDRLPPFSLESQKK